MFCFRAFILLFCTFFYLQPSFAIYPRTVPLGDNDYLIHETSDYRIIFDKQYEKHFKEITQKVSYYFNLAQSVQKTQLSEPLVFVFLSDKLQISNASASLFPFFQTAYYPAGFAGIDLLAMPSWLDTTLYHEITHVFQLQHSLLSPQIRNFIKSPFPLISYVFFNVFPNLLLPRFLLEGDAVLKESTIDKGGRLYSGHARALVYSQIKKYNARKLSRVLINQRIHPHNGAEKYLHGGYLSLFLQKKFTPENLNDFFKQNAQLQFFFPSNSFFTFFNSKALRRRFKSRFQGLTQQYIDQFKAQALLQKVSSERTLFKSAECLPFNVSEETVYFLTSDFKAQSHIRFYNKKLKSWNQQATQLLPGKLFKINNRYYSRSPYPVRSNRTVYSLFSESATPLQSFNSKHVEDIKGNSVLYIDSKNTLNGFKLYLNNQFYSLIHSNALFDSEQNIYYFKQNESARTLYKNKEALFTYYGYYGNIIDIDAQGTIYFTASTPYGSSIFQYTNGTIIRSVSSDTVIRARKVSEDQFLVCEIDSEGFNYKIVSSDESNEYPTLYQYYFDNSSSPIVEDIEDIEPEMHQNQQSHEAPFIKDGIENIKRQQNQQTHEPPFINDGKDFLFRDFNSLTLEKSYEKYRSFKNIKYSSLIQSLTISPYLIQDENNSIYLALNTDYFLTLIFSDDLQKNNILVNYRNIDLYNMSASLSYENRVYLLVWEIGYLIAYNNEKRRPSQEAFQNEFQTINFVQDVLQVSNFTHTGFLKFYYPLLRRGRWSSVIQTYLNLGIQPLRQSYQPYPNNQLLSVSTNELTHRLFMNTAAQWNLGYTFAYPLSIIPHRKFDLNLFTEHIQAFIPEGFSKNLIYGGNLNLITSLGYRFYINPSIWYIESSDEPLVRVRTTELLSFNFLNIRTTDLVNIYRGELYRAKSAGKASLRFLRPFDIPHLSKYILSITHLIPYFESSYKYLDKYYKEDPKLSYEQLKRMSQDLMGSVSFFEWQVGVEIAFLFHYNARFSTNISIGKSSPLHREFPSSTLLNFNLKSSF